MTKSINKVEEFEAIVESNKPNHIISITLTLEYLNEDKDDFLEEALIKLIVKDPHKDKRIMEDHSKLIIASETEIIEDEFESLYKSLKAICSPSFISYQNIDTLKEVLRRFAKEEDMYI